MTGDIKVVDTTKEQYKRATVKWVNMGPKIVETSACQFRWFKKKNGEKVLQQLWWQDRYDWKHTKPVWKDIEIVEEE